MGVIDEMVKAAKTIGIGAKEAFGGKSAIPKKPEFELGVKTKYKEGDLELGEKAVKGKSDKQTALNELMKEK